MARMAWVENMESMLKKEDENDWAGVGEEEFMDIAAERLDAWAKLAELGREGAQERVDEVAREIFARGVMESRYFYGGRVGFLLRACGAGSCAQIKSLLKAGADPRADGEQGYRGITASSLHWATSSLALRKANDQGARMAECLSVLAIAGADPRAKDGAGREPIHLAAHCGGEAAMRWALAHGADILAADNAGFTALGHAILSDSPKLARLAIEAGADIYSREGAPAMDLLEWLAERRGEEAREIHGLIQDARRVALERALIGEALTAQDQPKPASRAARRI